MNRYTIYDKNGNERVVQCSAGVSKNVGQYAEPQLEYHGTWMGECFVTLTVKCAVPVDFHIGDYIVYRDEKFVINYDPTVVKRARSGTYGEGFTYENVKFNALHNELTEVMFLDYVLDDNGLHYTSLPVFPFFAATIDDFCDRLQANTNRYCEKNGISADDRWLFLTPDRTRTMERSATCGMSETESLRRWNEAYGSGTHTDEIKSDVSLSISNQTIWSALSLIKSDFGLNFINRGRSVIIGSAGLPTNHLFKYGRGEGLYEIERHADAEQQIITKLYSYGNETNMPVRYYANIGVRCYSNPLTITFGSLKYYFLDIPFNKSLYTIAHELNGVKGYSIRVSNPSGQTATAHVSDPLGLSSISSGTNLDDLTTIVLSDSSFVMPLNGQELTILSGINKDLWPSEHRVYPQNLPNNMYVNRLMLPGFPLKSLYEWVKENGGENCDDATCKATWHGYTAYFSNEKYHPYVQSLNSTALGIREGVKLFDGSDDGQDIYPTIEGTGFDTIAAAETITDNGIFSESADEPTVTITLPSFGIDFDLKELAALGNNPTVSMKSGYCGGRSFTFESGDVTKNSDGTYKVVCKREHDPQLDLYFPYSYNKSISGSSLSTEPYQVCAGDKYVLTGIPMSDTYINANAIKLLEATLEFLSSNDYTQYTYLPKVDEIYMARQHDEALSDQSGKTRSLYKTIKEGDIMLFEDSDLHIDAQIFIDTLTIKEYGNAEIPTYDIVLREEKTVGTIQKMQQQISSLSAGSKNSGGVSGGGAKIFGNQIREMVEAYGSNVFLSKKDNDQAAGVIGFLKGLWVKAKDMFGIDENGAAKVSSVTIHTEAKDYGITNQGDATLRNIDAAQLIAGILETPGFTEAVGLIGNGFGVHTNANGKATLQTDNLFVLGQMIVNTLGIREVTYIGGTYLLTPAGSEVQAVKPLYAPSGREDYTNEWSTNNTVTSTLVGYRLYQKADDGTTATMNFWHVGDQAFCQTFNVTSGPGVYNDVRNHYWWRLVTGIGQETLYTAKTVVDEETGEETVTHENPQTYHYIDVSDRELVYLFDNLGNMMEPEGETTMFAGKELNVTHTVPAVGDKAVMLGSQTDKTRQGAVQITSENAFATGSSASRAAASIGIYDGINNYLPLSDYEIHFFSKDRVSMSARRFSWTTEDKTPKPPTIYRGDWYDGAVSGWGDEWTLHSDKDEHWICIKPSGTTTERPGTTAAWWKDLAPTAGRNGDAAITAYRWYKAGETVTKPANDNTEEPAALNNANALPTDKWAKIAVNRPSDGYHLWMIQAVKSIDANSVMTISDWSDPVRISGDTGLPGADASDIQWVYQRNDTGSVPDTPTSMAADKANDAYVPSGWNNHPQGVDYNNKYEFASFRLKARGYQQQWGDFQQPILWSHYGRNGMDGDGVEYVFVRTTTPTAPTIVAHDDSYTDSEGRKYTADEFLPMAKGGSLGNSGVECTDEPTGVDENNKYEWVAKRTMTDPDTVTGKRTWQKYSGTMSLWNNWSENTSKLDIDNEMDMVRTNSIGIVEETRTITTVVHLYDGAREVAIAKPTVQAITVDSSTQLTPTITPIGSALGKTLSWTFSAGVRMNSTYAVGISYEYNGITYRAVFTISASLGQPIYQIKPNMSAITFSRVAQNALFPTSRLLTLTVLKLDGGSTELTPTQSGMTIRYSLDGTMPASKTAGTAWPSNNSLEIGSSQMYNSTNLVGVVSIAMFNASGTLLDRESVPVMRDGENGGNGDTPVQAFRWYKAGLTPVTPTDTSSAEPNPAQNDSPVNNPHNNKLQVTPAKWVKSAPNRPQEEGDWYLWMTQSLKMVGKDGVVTYDVWTSPVRISGDRGTPGEDGVEREWIYRRNSNAGYNSTTGTAKGVSVSGKENDVYKCYLTDDFVPTDWNDNPQGVDKDNTIEYASWRDYDHTAQQWGDFQAPIIWSHYGRNGMDGDGVEYVFARTTSETAPKITNNNSYTSDGKTITVADDEFLPAVSGANTMSGTSVISQSRATDDPQGVTMKLPYEWVAKRTKGAANAETGLRSWEGYTVGDMQLWAKWSEDGNGIQSVTRTYAISSKATTASDTTPPSDVTAWTTASPATTEDKPYLWAKEVVTYTKSTSTTKYYMIGARGQNGIDAQDVEWAYIRTNTNVAPVIDNDSSYTDSKGNTYTADDHLPHVTGNTNIESNNSGVSGKTYECTDDPKGVNDTWPYEWEIKREKGAADANGHRAWTAYSGNMTLHNNLAASLLTIDIDNDSDQFGVDADGKVLAQQARSTVVSMAYGTALQQFTAAPTASLRYDDGTTVPTDVATAAVSDVSPSDAANTQYRVTVTIMPTGTNTPVFGKTGKSGLYVDISGTCAKGGPKTIRFTLEKVMSGAQGVSPTIYQLNPSAKSFTFSRDASNNLTPASIDSQINVDETVGNTTTQRTSAMAGITYSWGFDDDAAQATGKDVGTSISVSNTNAATKRNVWVQLSTGDRETLPILKDGTNGSSGKNACRIDLDNEMDAIQYQGDGITKVNSGDSVSTNIYFYDGTTDKSASMTFSVDTANTNIAESQYTLSGRVLTVTGLLSKSSSATYVNEGVVTVQCTYSGATHKAKFCVSRLVGQDKFALDITPNALALNTDDGWSANKVLTVKVMRTPAGGGTPTAVNPSDFGLAVNVSAGTLGTYSTSAKGYTLTVKQADVASIDNIVITLHKSGTSTAVYDRETIPVNKSANGRTMRTVSIYRWSTTVPTKPTSNAIPPTGWSLTDSGTHADDADLYMCWGTAVNGVLDSNGWSGPVRMSGSDGDAGKDGTDYEYIYYPTNTVNGYGDAPSSISNGQVSPGGKANGTTTTKNQDDWVPKGWYDSPQGVSLNNKYEYCAVRKKENKTWGSFSNPFPWSVYGDKGQDGDGVEYVYFLTKGESYKPTVTSTGSSGSESTSEYLPGQGMTGNNYNGSRWTDDPTGVSEEWPVEWVTVRHKIDDSWGNFSTPAVWAKWGKDGETAWLADLDNEMDSVSCDDTGHPVYALGDYVNVATTLALYYGSTPKTFGTPSVKRNGSAVTVRTSYSSSGFASGVQVVYNSSAKTLTVYYNTAATISGKDIFTITLTASDDSTVTRTLTFTVNGIIGDVYNLSPNLNQIKIEGTETSYSGLTCGYTKNVNGAITEYSAPEATTTYSTLRIDGKYNIYFRRRTKSSGEWETSYYLYTYSTYNSYVSALGVNTYDAVEFVLCTSTGRTASALSNIIDRETIYVITDGKIGAPGGNTATIYLYKRSATAPTSAGITKSLYYKFAAKKVYTDSGCTTELTATNANTDSNGWLPTIPSGSNPLYVTMAIAFNTGDTDTIASSEWVTPALYTENGINAATVFIYKRSESAVGSTDKPTAALYYQFADGRLYTSNALATEATTSLNGWSLAIPTADGNPCYVRQAAALSSANYDAINTSEWSDAVKLVEDGATYRSVDAYKRSTTVLASTDKPTITAIADTTTDAGNSWSLVQPSGTGDIYISHATFKNGSKISGWSAPVKFSGEGKEGTSPWVADLDNEMDSIACDSNGKPTSAQSIQTTVALYYGSTTKGFSITSVKRSYGSNSSYTYSTSGTANGGVTVTWNNSTGVITVSYATSATVTGRDIFTITMQSADNDTQTGAKVTRTLTLTVNGVMPGKQGDAAVVYKLVPSVSSIVKRKDGSYVPSTNITCGVTKISGNSTPQTAPSSDYTLKKILNGGSEQSYSETSPSAVTSNLTFVLYVDGTMVDKESVPLVIDGNDGVSPEAPPVTWVATAYKRFTSAPSDDKPTDTTNIYPSTLSYGNNWSKNPPAKTGGSSYTAYSGIENITQSGNFGAAYDASHYGWRKAIGYTETGGTSTTKGFESITIEHKKSDTNIGSWYNAEQGWKRVNGYKTTSSSGTEKGITAISSPVALGAGWAASDRSGFPSSDGWRIAKGYTVSSGGGGTGGIRTIGSGDTESERLPFYHLYNHSLCQQIYTPDEIGGAGTITSIAFYNTGSQLPSANIRSIDIYLVHSDKSAFSSKSDWITVSDDDLVYSGSSLFPAEWNTFELNKSFVYNGSSNLVVIVKTTGQYKSGPKFKAYTSTDSCSILYYNDNVTPDPKAPSVTANSLYGQKNIIQLGFAASGSGSTTVHNDGVYMADRIDFTTVGSDNTFSLTIAASTEDADGVYVLLDSTPNNATEIGNITESSTVKKVSGTESETVNFNVATAGSHFVCIVFKKDAGGDYGNNDEGYYRIISTVGTSGGGSGSTTTHYNNVCIVDRINFTTRGTNNELKLYISSSTEATYDGVYVSEVKSQTAAATTTAISSIGDDYKATGVVSNKLVTINVPNEGSYCVDVVFYKNSSNYANDDYGMYRLDTQEGTETISTDSTRTHLTNITRYDTITFKAYGAQTFQIELAASCGTSDYIYVARTSSASPTSSYVVGQKQSGTGTGIVDIPVQGNEESGTVYTYYVIFKTASTGSGANDDTVWYRILSVEGKSGGTVTPTSGLLWKSVATIVGTSVSGSWSDPVQDEGDEGPASTTPGPAGYTVIATPANLIINETSSGQYDVTSSNPAFFDFMVTKGSSTQNLVTNVAVTGNYCIKNTNAQIVTASKVSNGNRIQVTDVSSDAKSNKYTTGHLVITITADGRTFSMTIPIAVNYAATMFHGIVDAQLVTIAEDVKTSIENDGTFVVNDNNYQSYVDAVSGLQTWKQQKESIYDDAVDSITNINTRLSSAEGNISSVSTTANNAASDAAEAKSSVTTVVQTANRISSQLDSGTNLLTNSFFELNSSNWADNWNRSGTSVYMIDSPLVAGGAQCYIPYQSTQQYLRQQVWGSSSYRKLADNSWFTLTFYAKCSGNFRVMLRGSYTSRYETAIVVNGKETQFSGSSNLYVDIATLDSGSFAFYSLQFKTKEVKDNSTTVYIEFTVSASDLYIAVPRLYKGLSTGINIQQNIIDVTANNFTIRNNDGNEIFSTDASGITTMQDVVIKGSLMFHDVKLSALTTSEQGAQLFTMYDSSGLEILMSNTSSTVARMTLNCDTFILTGAQRDYTVFLPPASFFPGASVTIINSTFSGGNGSKITSNPSNLTLSVCYRYDTETLNIQDTSYASNNFTAGVPTPCYGGSSEYTLFGAPDQTKMTGSSLTGQHGIMLSRYSGAMPKRLTLVSTTNPFLSTKTYYAWMIVEVL